MIKADLHIHSDMSPDSSESIDNICVHSIELGLKTIAITDHYEFYYPNRKHPVFNFDRVEESQKIIEKARSRYKDSLDILFGIEIGQPHLDYHNGMKLVSSFDFDFVLASFHKVEAEDLSNHDYQDEEKRERTLSAYLDGLLLIASCFDFDSLAHFDLIKRYSQRSGKILRAESEEERCREILRTLAKRGKALEVNTSLFHSYAEPMPSSRILGWFREEGGVYVTVGSDAHRAEDISFGFEKAENIIKESGLTSLVIYQKRQVSLYGFVE